MSETLHDRLEQVFSAALDRPQPERMTFLEEACGDDERLRTEVRELLEAYAEVDEVHLPDGDHAPFPSVEGRQVGQYCLRRRISSGGMGVVYEAVQDHPHRTVALKIMRAGMSSRAALRRFAFESDILARLRHPNVAQVFDAGVYDDGSGAIPYFAMEYVPSAKTITEFAEAAGLGTRQRLELFTKVCGAVYHGHQKGVIHRDLKPANILVDAQGEPKVIDFGVARATDSDMVLTTLQTDVGQLVGTVPYMSPEQVTGDPARVDTRSDVYSLAVICYELLTGRLPYDVSGKTVPEAVRVIRDEEATSLSAIDRIFRGDLDTIVAKGLEKDTDRRYQSALELAADIRRYLRDEPIIARPPTMLYQFRKFTQRNRALVVAASILFVALMAGGSVSTVFAIGQAREADAARAINAFFNAMFASVDPMQLREYSGFSPDEWVSLGVAERLGGDVTVAEMLRQTSEEIEKYFPGKPQLQAAAHETIGMTLHSLFRYEEAQRHLRTALSLRQENLGEEHPDTLRSKLQLGYSLYQTWSGPEFYAEAETLARSALEGMTQRYGADDPRTLSCGVLLANILSGQRRFVESDRQFEETLRLQEQRLGPHHRDVIATLHYWSGSCFWQQRLLRCQELAQDALERSRRSLGPDDAVTIMSELFVGLAHWARQEYDQAETIWRSALDDSRRVFGGDHPHTYLMKRLVALSLRRDEDQQEKESLFKEALEGQQTTVGDSYRETAITKWHYGVWLQDQGRLEEAIDLFGQAATTMQETHGDVHVFTSRAKRDLASALQIAGRLEEARKYAQQAIESARVVAASPDACPDDIATYAGLLLTCQPADLRDPEEALRVMRDEKARGDVAGGYMWGLLTRADAYEMTGQIDRATEERVDLLSDLLEKPANARELNTPAWGIVKHPSLWPEAYRLALRAAERATTLDPDHRQIAYFLNTLGVAQYRCGQYERAVATLRRSDELGDGADPGNAAFIAMACHQLGDAERAEAALARLRELMQDPAKAADPDFHGFRQEAESLGIGR